MPFIAVNICKLFPWVTQVDSQFHPISPLLFPSQVLEDGIATHQAMVASLNSNGEDIIAQSSSVDRGMLQEKLEGLNARWKSVCAEVASWKER